MATRFLVVEYPGSWTPEPLDVFAPETSAALRSAVKAVRGQLLLVRRPDLATLHHDELRLRPHRWWVVDTTAGTQVDGTWTGEDGLAPAAAALADRAAAPTRPAPFTLLVCCHARRDQCCAIAGRPLATQLATRWPEETWQCTHLGGHRFAPTFLILPDGVNYGRVPPGLGESVVDDHLAGRVHPELLRGHCRYEGWEQSAIADVLRTVEGPLTGAASEAIEEGEWDVTVRLGDASYVRRVRAVRHARVPLSCGDAPPKPSVTYDVRPAGAPH